MRSSWLVALAVAASACSRPPASEAPAPGSTAAAGSSAPLVWLEDDLAGATAKAKAEHKVLFVDAWAPWCHTCLSMKSFVLGDAALRPLAELAVFASIDFDKPESAGFVEKHHVKSLPTFLVVDPDRDEVLGTWVGSGTAKELRGVIEVAAAAKSGAKGDAIAEAFRSACAARARGDAAASAKAFEVVVKTAPADHPLRSEALLGWMEMLDASGAPAACVAAADAHGKTVSGSSVPSDLAVMLLQCAGHLPPAERDNPRADAIARLRAFVDRPPDGASVDDRGDAAGSLADALAEAGDAAGAKSVREKWLAMLDDAVKKAPSVEVAHTFDYQRANALVALGRAPEAVAMLEERVKQMPDNYEPAARLASALTKADRWADALPVARKAVELAYGSRKLRYLALEAKILGKLGDTKAQLEVLEKEVAGWRSLPPGQTSAASLADAEKRRDEAKHASPAR